MKYCRGWLRAFGICLVALQHPFGFKLDQRRAWTFSISRFTASSLFMQLRNSKAAATSAGVRAHCHPENALDKVRIS